MRVSSIEDTAVRFWLQLFEIRTDLGYSCKKSVLLGAFLGAFFFRANQKKSPGFISGVLACDDAPFLPLPPLLGIPIPGAIIFLFAVLRILLSLAEKVPCGQKVPESMYSKYWCSSETRVQL